MYAAFVPLYFYTSAHYEDLIKRQTLDIQQVEKEESLLIPCNIPYEKWVTFYFTVEIHSGL